MKPTTLAPMALALVFLGATVEHCAAPRNRARRARETHRATAERPRQVFAHIH